VYNIVNKVERRHNETWRDYKRKKTGLGMTMEDLANKSGLSKGYISMLEKGENPKTKKPIIPSIETFMGLAHALALDIDKMIGVIEPGQKISLASRGKTSWEKTLAKNHEVKNLVPVLGRVQAGLPIEAVENIIAHEEITEDMARKGEYFGLQVKGDSMEPRFVEGDIVIVRKQPDVETG
jgi:repressor LexA